MKNKILLFISLLYFFIFHTKYFWEGQTGAFAMLLFIFGFLLFFILILVLVYQIYKAYKEKLNYKLRLVNIVVIPIVLATIWFFPQGLIDFEKYESKDLLVAESEGVASCLTTIALKEDKSFKERIGCFGLTDVFGTYALQKDTIIFEYKKNRRIDARKIKYGVIKESRMYNPQKFNSLYIVFLDEDSVEREFKITKNNLIKH